MYGIPKVSNHWFATYHIYHKKKLGMEELTYNFYLLYRSGPFGIVRMQTDDILIFANNNFASKKKADIKVAKIITKDQEQFTFTQTLKFNGAQIKLDSKGILLTKKSHVDGIFLVTDHNADSTSLRGITKKKLSPKE